MPNFPDFYIFGVIDAAGVTRRDVCSDTCEDICIDAINAEGGFVHFESDAYHLEDWANDQGFHYFKHGYMFDDLGNPSHIFDNGPE